MTNLVLTISRINLTTTIFYHPNNPDDSHWAAAHSRPCGYAKFSHILLRDGVCHFASNLTNFISPSIITYNPYLKSNPGLIRVFSTQLDRFRMWKWPDGDRSWYSDHGSVPRIELSAWWGCSANVGRTVKRIPYGHELPPPLSFSWILLITVSEL